MKVLINEVDSVVTILNMPLPPSVNQAYNPIRGRMVKDKNVRAYELKVKKAFNESEIAQVATLIKKTVCPKPCDICSITVVLKFQYSRLFCKTSDKKSGRKVGDVKTQDVDNRLKALLDSMKRILGFDDSHFFEIIARKVPVMNLQDEGVDISIKPMKL